MVATFFEKSRQFLAQQQTSIMSAAVLIGGMSVVSAVLGIANKRLLVSVFVDSRPLVDSFFAAFRIPDFLFQLLVVGVLSATFIPVYSRVEKIDRKQAQDFVASLMTFLSIAYIVTATVVGILAPILIRKMTGPAFSDMQVSLAVAMMRLMLVAQFFFLISNFLSGILQSGRHFLLPALSPVMYNLGIIVGTVFLSRWFGIFGPAYGVLLGALAHVLIQFPLAKKLGFKYHFSLDWKSPHVREVMRLMVPRGATQSTNAVEDFIGVYIATSFGNTLLTLLTLASALMAAPVRFFGVSIAQAALPFLTSEAKEHDMSGFSSLLVKTLHQIAFFMFPAGALLLVLRIPLVRLAYGARGFPWSDTVLLGRLVALFALAIAAQAMIHVLLRAFYALKETRIPFYGATISMAVNIAVMWFGAYVLKMGVVGVPLGSSVAAWTECLFLLVILLNKLHSFSAKEFIIPQLKMLAATIAMGLALYLPLKLLDTVVFDTTHVVGLIFLTIVVGICGTVIYLVFSLLLRVEQLQIVRSIHGKLREAAGKLGKTQEVLNIDVADES